MDNEEKEIYLTELIDIEVLQRMQDAFAEMTGMAALTTDHEGVPVTIPSNFTSFCNYVRSTSVGSKRCEWCDRFGAKVTWESGQSATYYCHAGLVDYAAPIIADGKLVGCFIGGQALTKKPNAKKKMKVAEEIGVDPEKLFEEAKKVHILDKASIDHAAQFLYTVATVLSDMAYGKYLAMLAKKDIEKATNMKSDFLANMSHEIRTPMNAVIGMAEMALREELPPVARDYVHQIKASGNALLAIINDILDFSKIESGKMDIVPVEYETMSIVNDICNILITRLENKNVELVLNISPDIPNKLFGDNIRIKQILLNLANNAIKFTSQGRVAIHMSHEVVSKDVVNLLVSVEDTGIGIKKEDLKKIFRSFEQVDSKRNRNNEGTGLGLAISKQLIALMNGDLGVESEYEKGSKFSFVIPQKVVDFSSCIQVKNPQSVFAVSLTDNFYTTNQLEKDCAYFGIEYREIASVEEIDQLSTEKSVFAFIENSVFTAEIEEFIKEHQELTAVLLTNFSDSIQCNVPNILMVKKPLYTLNEAMIFNRESLCFHDQEADIGDLNFIAPEAEILIVDDNAINLTVAEGLLRPLKMKVDTSLSGKDAIEKISEYHYDIVFMDHMMPELDGVETTHIIRRLHPEYSDVPIIALTANAVGGTRDVFLKEGMNDFVSKPIELRALISKVKQWLPIDKIQKVNDQDILEDETSVSKIVIGDLDTEYAVRMLGSEKLFWSVLKDYYRVIEKKSVLIKELVEKEDWAGYTIEVHSLKSSSKQIGAISLSEKAANMEKAGNMRNIEQIHKCTDDMLQQYREYIPVLKPFIWNNCEEDVKKKDISSEILATLFVNMQRALDDLDIDQMEAVIEEMGQYRYDVQQEELFEKLKECVEEVDVDECEKILFEWDELRSAGTL